MNKKRVNKEVNNSIFSVWNFLIFFVLVATTVSCSFYLFFYNSNIPKDVIVERAPITFINVIFISLLFTFVDALRRKFTVEKPVKRILEGTIRITSGDFNSHIESFHFGPGKNEFDVIIDGLNLMAEELSSIETLRTDFIANVSHELKTPLAIIGNYATLLQDKDLKEDKRIEYTENLVITTKRLSELITNILKLNKLDNQNIYQKFDIFNLSEQLCECLLGFEEIWEQKNIEIQTEIEEDVNIKSSSELLSLVWNNLISNAVKFTEPGGSIKLTLRMNKGIIEVSVKDTGCGISKATGRYIFDKFYQGDTSHSSYGNGLGLALVKRVIDVLGYDISVDSELGKGSTFTVYIKE